MRAGGRVGADAADPDRLAEPSLETFRRTLAYAGGRLTYEVPSEEGPGTVAPCIAEHERRAVTIANPHVYTLEDGAGHTRVDADQLRFKAAADPYGLLNPGKMRSYRPVA